MRQEFLANDIGGHVPDARRRDASASDVPRGARYRERRALLRPSRSRLI